MKPSRRTYAAADPNDAFSPCELRSILDSHGLRIPKDVGHGEAARVLQLIYDNWVDQQRISPRHQYLMPFRVTLTLLLQTYEAVEAWRVLADAINDPDAGLQIVQLRHGRRTA